MDKPYTAAGLKNARTRINKLEEHHKIGTERMGEWEEQGNDTEQIKGILESDVIVYRKIRDASGLKSEYFENIINGV
jgi:hypothetical protein